MSAEASVATFNSYGNHTHTHTVTSITLSLSLPSTAKLIKHYKELHKSSDMPSDLVNLAKEGAALVAHMNTIG